MDKPPRAVDPKIGGFSVLKGIPPVAQDVFQRWRLGQKIREYIRLLISLSACAKLQMLNR